MMANGMLALYWQIFSGKRIEDDCWRGSAIFNLILENYKNVSSLQYGIFDYNQHGLLPAHRMLIIVHDDD